LGSIDRVRHSDVINIAQLVRIASGLRCAGTCVHFVTYLPFKPGRAEMRGARGVRALDELPVILGVEDDQLVQTVVEETLAEGGFEPAVVASGEEAVALLQGHKGKYRALVTDIDLQGKMDGWEVAQQAREIDPEFPIVYMSGASAADWPVKGVPNSIMLAKPFAPAQLLTAISNLLNSGTPTT
jgi:CheY-like chemotaxis protein